MYNDHIRLVFQVRQNTPSCITDKNTYGFAEDFRVCDTSLTGLLVRANFNFNMPACSIQLGNASHNRLPSLISHAKMASVSVVVELNLD
jgi:hypothetical protein